MKDEAVKLMCEYLKIDTTNPPGNEEKAVAFFKKIFEGEGIEYKTYEPKKGRVSIRAQLSGSGERGPVLMISHTDVVPANRDEWSFDPFSGEIVEGMIRGRGALDMKGIGIMELTALLTLKREGAKLNRDLVFLAAADEEMGGAEGAGYLVENHFDDFRADVVLNEGGFGVSDIIPGRPVMMISSGEKGICWLKLIREGLPGHGSAPHGQNALENLNKALVRLLSEETPITITPIISEYFKNLASGWEFLKPFVEDGREETLVKVLKESGLLALPQIAAMVKNTISLNVMKAGDKTNIIPSHAEAVLDCRVLPGQDIDEFIGQIKSKLKDDEIKIEPIERSDSTESPTDTEHYRIIEETVADHFPNAVIAPSLLMGTSDSRFLRKKGIPSYGICPAFVPMEHIKMVHGIDEQISVENMIKGSEVFTDIVRRMVTG
ncbi:MAG: M20/M25/M40 family metallo-hydrolase [Deltaproteobacteria bacterium]|uniref:M20/M25/M40 family metallo-hydrolase n=1 Tax=Candidatus Zymogenus saltonus TaxID=2844893 RepID=A0A9D8KDK9_9DELT|nr:M20/M25/M40 family metallo-hydrolase [Candidatus Zymogenus saltonus]